MVRFGRDVALSGCTGVSLAVLAGRDNHAIELVRARHTPSSLLHHSPVRTRTVARKMGNVCRKRDALDTTKEKESWMLLVCNVLLVPFVLVSP